MTNLEWATFIKEIVLALAGVGTVLIAFSGLKSWGKEHKTRVFFDSAKELLKACYTLREAVARARSPFILASEFPDGYQNHPAIKRNSAEEEAQAYAFLYRNRFEPVIEAVKILRLQTIEAEALWGSNIKEKCSQLQKAARRLQVAMQQYVSNIQRVNEDFSSDKNYAKSIRADISAFDDDDPASIASVINSNIEEIEIFLKPYLKRSK
jgi:hypothetical protein